MPGFSPNYSADDDARFRAIEEELGRLNSMLGSLRSQVDEPPRIIPIQERLILDGDTTGPTSENTVERIWNIAFTVPVAGDDGFAVFYDHGGLNFELRAPSVTRPVITVTPSSNIATPDASLGTRFKITNGANLTINAPTNPPAAGLTQDMTIEVANSSGGAITVTLQTGAAGRFRYGGDIPSISDVAASKSGRIGVVWDVVDERWDVVANVTDF